MSNLLKGGFVNFREGEARIIDSNEIAAKRLGRNTAENNLSPQASAVSPEGFRTAEFEEMDEETRNALFGEESGNIYREKPAYDGPSPEELLEAARAEIEQMKEAAAAEAEACRERAAEEGRQAGYQDGFAKGNAEALVKAEKANQKANEAIAETEAVRKKLQEEYEAKLQEMEPMVIDELIKIYDHVFEAGLKDQKDIIFHLLDSTLHRIDTGREFIVRVSQADYEYINTRKDELLKGLPGVRMDLVADLMLKRGQGMIETGGGLFDCSIDVELQELGRRIHMLAYER